MAITAAFDLETRQYDAVNAFANSSINEPTYCKVHPGWIGNSDIPLRLQQALYELTQLPVLWHGELSTTPINLRLDHMSGVECVFTNTYMIVFFFVDDICVLYDRPHIAYVDVFEASLFTKYEMKPSSQIYWFLGICVSRDKATRRLWLCHDSYIDKIGAKFNITGSKARGSPLPVEDIIKFDGIVPPHDILYDQQKVVLVNFLAVIKQPDVAHAISKLSEHLTNPSPRHIELVNRVIDYLVSTRNLSILFTSQPLAREIAIVSSDASFADDLQTRYSSQGYAFKLFGSLIDWRANKQKTHTVFY